MGGVRGLQWGLLQWGEVQRLVGLVVERVSTVIIVVSVFALLRLLLLLLVELLLLL